MANMAYRCALKNPDYCVALIVSGFTGQLKSWWDNALTFQQKKDILEYVHQEGEPEPVKQLILHYQSAFHRKS